MFAVWNDHCGNGISTKDVHHRLYPALQTLAVKMWTATPSLAYDAFNEQRQRLSEAPGVNQNGRLSDAPGLVYELDSLQPGDTTPYAEIGYDYRVSFDVEGQAEERGTELFRSRDAVFYLSDPIRGMLGFARDGYLNTFTYPVQAGKRMNIAIEGDHQSTRLYIDGKLVEELNTQTRYFDKEGKSKMKNVRTLVFPLQQAGHFKSTVTGLKVYQQ